MNQDFLSYSTSFINKIKLINPNAVSNTPLVNNYLKSVIYSINYYTKIYSFVLKNVLVNTNKSKEEICLLDFGCGNGLLALFAKHCGFKKVFACDFNKNFVEATSRLSELLNIKIDQCILCSENELFNNFNTYELDVIVGTDVIEHIYNLEIFYKNIAALNPKMITAFTTASVNDNFFKTKSLHKLMQKDELIGTNENDATANDEFVGMPYLNIRKKIVIQEFPNIEPKKTEYLAKQSRGLKEEDIKVLVTKYLKTGELKNEVLNHPFNTCDPISGNFTERILSTSAYHKLYSINQFSLQIISGNYNVSGNIIKSFIQFIFNLLISIFRKQYLSRTIAPLILLIGTPKK